MIQVMCMIICMYGSVVNQKGYVCMGYAVQPQNNWTHGKANRKFYGIVFHFTHHGKSILSVYVWEKRAPEGQTYEIIHGSNIWEFYSVE